MPMKSGPCDSAFWFFWISASLTDIQKMEDPNKSGLFHQSTDLEMDKVELRALPLFSI
jgi:hypothetical protein